MNRKERNKNYKNVLIKVPRFNEAEGLYSTPKSTSLMRKIKSGDTKVEMRLRKAIWNCGYRYRIGAKGIVGKPDMVFRKNKLVVFIDGDFWHGYNWQEKRKKLKSNKQYWIPKIERNMQRDKEVTQILTEQGWFVVRIWEHEIENDFEVCLHNIVSILKKRRPV